MTRLRLLVLSTLLLVSAALGGCKIDAVEPIVPLASAQADPALYGVWRHREGDETTYVHIGPAIALGGPKEGQPMRIVIVDHKLTGVTVEDYTVYGARVGRHRYLSVAQEEQGKREGYLFVRYRVDGGTVRFASVDGKALADAIRAGRIQGTVRGEGLGTDATITADPQAIAAFLAASGDALFNRPVTLRRVAAR